MKAGKLDHHLFAQCDKRENVLVVESCPEPPIHAWFSVDNSINVPEKDALSSTRLKQGKGLALYCLSCSSYFWTLTLGEPSLATSRQRLKALCLRTPRGVIAFPSALVHVPERTPCDALSAFKVVCGDRRRCHSAVKFSVLWGRYGQSWSIGHDRTRWDQQSF